MDIKYFAPHWGSEELNFIDFAGKVKTAGFDGVEMSLPFDNVARMAITSILKDHDLLLIAQHWETVDKDFSLHKLNYEKRLRNLACAKPLFINSQTGKDYYTFEQNQELIALADAVSKETDISVVHETHRGKFSFAAHITRKYLEQIPGIELALDISHWCNVAETFLHDQPEALALAFSRTYHIHARVGYPQGPQVPDPRDKLWADALAIHLSWWKQVVNSSKLKGRQTLTITPEFGAPPYTVLLPGTHQPIASQWDINVFMMEYLKQQL